MASEIWLTILVDPETREAERRQNLLFRDPAKTDRTKTDQAKTTSADQWSRYFEVGFFVVLALPACATVAAWWLGGIPADNVNWLQLGANIAVFVTLLKVWVEIKKLDEEVAVKLEEQIKQSKAQEVRVQ